MVKDMIALTQMEDRRPPDGLEAGQWERIRDILDSALQLPLDLRDAYLTEACDGDAALRSEVESLIAASEQSAFLDRDPLPSLTPTLNMTVPYTGRTIGNYRVVDRIGEGGMGIVFKAVDSRLGRTVALKIISHPASPTSSAGEEKRRFFREAKAASALNHPNIVTIYEYDSDAEVDFIAMEYIRGTTLHALLAEHRPPLETLLGYAVQAAGAVAAAHAAGIVHRDLKTKNIMVTEGGTVKVLDFGLAKESGARIAETQTGAVLGTPAYMSPEQAKGEPTDHRSDIFSFGVILYEIACGRRPFSGAGIPSTLYAVVNSVPTAPDKLNPALSKPLAALIARCISKHPEERPESMEVVCSELAAALDQLKGPVAKRRQMPRRSVLIGGAIAAVVVAAAGIWLPRPEHPRTVTYTILAQQMLDGRPTGAEYVASPTDTFHAGWRFRLRIASPQPGFFYLITHGPGANGADRLWILYPREKPAKPSQQLLTGWYVFDQNTGTERLWMLFSDRPLALLANTAGEVRDPSASRSILDYLTKLPPASTSAIQDGVQLRAAGDVLGASLDLRHQ
jgi:predicted Ser/Thr protein kinase